jgi:hypothetical protein
VYTSEYALARCNNSTSPSLFEHSLKVAANASPVESRARVLNSLGRLPLSFEANRGQTDPRVRFVSRGSGYTLFLTRRGEAVLSLRKSASKRDPRQEAANVPVAEPVLETPTPSTVVRMNLVDASTTPQREGKKKTLEVGILRRFMRCRFK